ncbi:MAG: hypothetical protein EXR94_01775 [Gemmatimonadetes bacterium]|nr:hypothetical protein [Gemmatimonadota bacterium]
MQIISIIGHQNAGKTTLLIALALEFHRRKKRVATIKHVTHAPTLDREGSDTHRHFHEGLTDGGLIASPDLQAVFERRPDDTGPEALARPPVLRRPRPGPRGRVPPSPDPQDRDFSVGRRTGANCRHRSASGTLGGPALRCAGTPSQLPGSPLHRHDVAPTLGVHRLGPRQAARVGWCSPV